MWVPLVENNEHQSDGADYFIKMNIDNLLSRDPEIDAVLLACTHYPLLKDKIRKYLPGKVKLLSQGEIVAHSLEDYLQRHPDMEVRLTRDGKRSFFTTDAPADFDTRASLFFGEAVSSSHVAIN